jgi:hypothetical protein
VYACRAGAPTLRQLLVWYANVDVEAQLCCMDAGSRGGKQQEEDLEMSDED